MRLRFLFLALLVSGCASQPHRGLVANEDEIPDGWTLYATAHYQVLTDAGDDVAKTTADRLESVLHLYGEILPSKRDVPRFPVRVILTYADYRAYGGEDGTGGCFDETTNELVLTRFLGYAPEGHRARMPSEQELLTTTFHEAWHQYFHWYLDSDQDPPAWFDEGMADYFGQSRPKTGRPRGEAGEEQPIPVEWKFGRPHPAWLYAIRRAIAENRYVPLRDFVKYTREQYYKDPSLCYPEGWSFCHFLLNSSDERTHQIPSAIVRAMRDHASTEQALAEAFAGVDFEKLEEGWKNYVLGIQ